MSGLRGVGGFNARNPGGAENGKLLERQGLYALDITYVVISSNTL